MQLKHATMMKLIRHLVMESVGAKRVPRLHPNGFIQLDLDAAGEMRLHVWPAQPLPIQGQKTKHPIHDHNFDMESAIFRGALRNILYQAHELTRLEDDVDFPVYRLHSAEMVGATDTVLKPINHRSCAVLQTSAEDFQAGDCYSMSKAVLHESLAVGLTATLVTKLRADPTYRPRVAVPVGITPDNDYRRAASEGDKVLWHVIGRAIE